MMTISAAIDFLADYSEMYPSNKEWIPLPLKENEWVTDYGDKKYLIVDTRKAPLYSHIELIRRRYLGIAIPLFLGTITFIITSLINQSPLLKITTLISSIAIPFFFASVRALFFQKIETHSVGILMDDKKERLIALFGKKMIAALGGFDALSRQNDWDGRYENIKKGIQYCLDQKEQVHIVFYFLCYDEASKKYQSKTGLIKKVEEGWHILESNGLFRIYNIDGTQTDNNIIEHGTPKEEELLKRVACFCKKEALSSIIRDGFKEEEYSPEKGSTKIYMLDCPYNDQKKIIEISKELAKREFKDIS